jgi:hypothetical protein
MATHDFREDPDSDGWAVIVVREPRPWWWLGAKVRLSYIRLTRMQATVLYQSLHKLSVDRALGGSDLRA